MYSEKARNINKWALPAVIGAGALGVAALSSQVGGLQEILRIPTALGHHDLNLLHGNYHNVTVEGTTVSLTLSVPQPDGSTQSVMVPGHVAQETIAQFVPASDYRPVVSDVSAAGDIAAAGAFGFSVAKNFLVPRVRLRY